MANKVQPLVPAMFDLAEQIIAVHYATLPEHATREILLEPSFWSSVSKKLRPFHEIKCMYQHTDHTWMVDLIVLDAGANYAKVVEKAGTYQEIDTADLGAGLNIEGFEVKWGNRHTGFRILREADKSCVKDGFTTRNAATSWLFSNLASLKRVA